MSQWIPGLHVNKVNNLWASKERFSVGSSYFVPVIWARSTSGVKAATWVPMNNQLWFRRISTTRINCALQRQKGFPGSSASKESACNAGDLGSIPGLRRFPGEGKGYPLQCSGLENSKDCIVPGVAKSQTQLSNFQFHFLMGLMQFKEYVKWS